MFHTLVAHVPHLLMAMPLGFDLDTSGLIDQAENIFNGLQGAYVPIIGISLGVSLLSFIVAEIRRAF